jgi:ankyrin repeat protein
MKKSPFPSVFELIREFAKALDLKGKNTKIDELVKDPFAHYGNIKICIEEVIFEPAKDYISEDFAQTLRALIRVLLESYVELVSTNTVISLNRDELNEILISHWLIPNLKSCLSDVDNEIFDPKVTARCINGVLEKYVESSPSWKKIRPSLHKDIIDRVSYWKRGEHLPSITYINEICSKLIQNQSDKAGQPPLSIPQEKIKELLHLARMVDYFSNKVKPSQYSYGGQFLSKLRQKQIENSKSLPAYTTSLTELYKLLDPRNIKPENAKQLIKAILIKVEGDISNAGQIDRHAWLVELFKARYSVASQDFKKANTHYKQSVELAIYRVGNELESLIQEAFVIAALDIGKRPDKAFLSQLKSLSLLFGYDIPSVRPETPSKNFSDNVEDWEVDLFKSGADTMFPSSFFFDSFNWNNEVLNKGPMLVTTADFLDFKPNFSKSNLVHKLPAHNIDGGKASKYFPQLTLCILNNNLSAVEQLLEKEASVNVKTSSNESPIMLALEKINITYPDYNPNERIFFDLVSQHDHQTEIINSRSSKKRLLPIIQAVESGQADVVQKVLSLGANIDARGHVDEQTALNVCIRFIGWLKYPDKIRNILNNVSVDDTLRDAHRRYSGGQHGMKLEDQDPYLENNREFSEASAQYVQNVINHTSLESMYKILNVLLDNGANPNAEMLHPLKGYTPLMLAVEFDLEKEFSLMVTKGGDPLKKYTSPNNQSYNCWDVARNWKAENCLLTLDRIKGSLLLH